METSFRFGRFVLDTAARELRADGTRIPLGARAFDVLVALVENRERLVTKDELLERVWPGLVVEENNLQVQISALRKVLGSEALATIPGRGYRFCLPVEDGASKQAEGVSTAVPGVNARRRPLLLVVACIGFLLVIGSIWALTRVHIQSNAPVTSETGVDVKSIAVLPFVDMSEKQDQEYLADGLSEELIDQLSHAADLKVIARTSSFQFKGKYDDTRLIGKKLGVAHLLEGSIRRSGEQLRVTAQLIRATDGMHLWSQTYNRHLKDVFQVQEEIAATVARSLQTALSTTTDQTDPEAYRLRLEGDFFAKRTTQIDTLKAIALYQQAIKRSPNYAVAWANLGLAYGVLAAVFVPEQTSISDTVVKARGALDRALAIEPNLARAHLARGWLLQDFDWDWPGAQAAYRHALDLDPDMIAREDTHAAVAAQDLMWIFGRLDHAIAVVQQSLVRDPLSIRKRYRLGLLLFFAQRYRESADAFVKVSELNPSYASAKSFLAAALLFQGKKSEALVAVQQEPDESWKFAMLPIIYWELGMRGDSDATLQHLEQTYANAESYQIAETRAYRGEIDAAFAWLDKAYRQRDPGMQFLRVDPLLRNLRGDARYRALLVKMKLDGDGRDVIGETKRRP